MVAPKKYLKKIMTFFLDAIFFSISCVYLKTDWVQNF